MRKVEKKVKVIEKIDVIYKGDGESYQVMTPLTKEQFCGYRNAAPNFLIDISNVFRSIQVFICDLIFLHNENRRPDR